MTILEAGNPRFKMLANSDPGESHVLHLQMLFSFLFTCDAKGVDGGLISLSYYKGTKLIVLLPSQSRVNLLAFPKPLIPFHWGLGFSSHEFFEEYIQSITLIDINI
jgi:hypothetical protein